MPADREPPSTRLAEEQRIADAYARRAGDAERYAHTSPGHLFLMQGKERALLSALRNASLGAMPELRILEVGCGNGEWLLQLLRWGAVADRLAGVDLLEPRIAEARRRLPAGCDLRVGSASSLPYADASFDVVLQSTMLTSVLDAVVRREVATEMLRVLRRDGVVLWYDFVVDNPRNPDVRGVGLPELRRLFTGCEFRLRRTTLAPPLARAVAPAAWPLATVLSGIPFLCTHLCGTIRKR